MTISEVKKAMLADVPVKLTGSTAYKLCDTGHEYTRIAALSFRRSKRKENFIDIEVVDEIDGRSCTLLHCDPKDVEVADSVPEAIRRAIYAESVETAAKE